MCMYEQSNPQVLKYALPFILHSHIPFPLPKRHAEIEAQEPFPYPFHASLKI
jgi:hypothetical protein